VGQILSLAMMLRESFRMSHAADAIEQAVRSVWHERYCTADIRVPRGSVIGTDAFAARVAERAAELLEPARPLAKAS
jgi:3-isopropylmalate dehydrogenase